MQIEYFEYLPICLGYLLGAVSTTIVHLSTGKPLINPTTRPKAITRTTKSSALKWWACIVGAVIALVPTFLFIKPDTFEAALTAAFVTIPYVHTGAIAAMIQERASPSVK